MIMSTYSLLIFSAFASLLNGLDCKEVGSCYKGIEINCIENGTTIEMIEYEGNDCNSNDSTNQTIIDCLADGSNNTDTIICRDDQLITIETNCISYCIENDGELAGHRDGRSNSTADPIGINTQDSDDDELNSTMAATIKPSNNTQHRRIQSDNDGLTDSTMGPTMEPTLAPIDSTQHRDGRSNSTVDSIDGLNSTMAPTMEPTIAPIDNTQHRDGRSNSTVDPIKNIQDSNDGLTDSTMGPTMEPTVAPIDNIQDSDDGLNSTMTPTMAPIDSTQHRDGGSNSTMAPTMAPTIINRLLN